MMKNMKEYVMLVCLPVAVLLEHKSVDYNRNTSIWR